MNAFIPRGRLHRALAVNTVTRLALRLLVMPSPVLGACHRLGASCTKPLCRQHLMCRFPSAIGLQVTIAPEIFDGLNDRTASSLATSRHSSDYTSSTAAAAAAAANRHRENDPQKRELGQNIFSLARHGRAGEVEASLLRGFPADARDEFGNSLLIVGCQVRRRLLFSSISFALTLALPLNFPAMLHYSSIRHGTGTQNGNKKIVKLALKYGCEINAVNSTGNTALHFATRFGHAELAQYLIDKGANVNITNSEGRRCSER